MVAYIYLAGVFHRSKAPRYSSHCRTRQTTIQSLPSSPKFTSSNALALYHDWVRNLFTNIVQLICISSPAQPKPSNINKQSTYASNAAPKARVDTDSRVGQPQPCSSRYKSRITTSHCLQHPLGTMVLPPASSLGGSFGASAMSSPPLFASPPAMRSMLAPSKPHKPSWNANKKTNNDWGDFDPLA